MNDTDLNRAVRAPQYYPQYNYQTGQNGFDFGNGGWNGEYGRGGRRGGEGRRRHRNRQPIGPNPHGHDNYVNHNTNDYGYGGGPNNYTPTNIGYQGNPSPGLSGDWGDNRPPNSWGRTGPGRGRRWWRPSVQAGGPPPPDGYSGYRPHNWGGGGGYGGGGEDYRDRKKRISEIRYDEYIRRIYGNESTEDDLLKPEDLNGREIAKPGDFPHVAAIGIRLADRQKDWKCTGSLISEYFILTAAHCTNFGGQAPTHVKIGDINLYVREDTVATQRSRIEQIYVHPSYNSGTYYNDIALIKMRKPAVLTRHVRPARLWVADEIPYNVAFAMGYGATQFGKAPTDVLTYFNLTLIGNEECNNTLPSLAETPNGIIDSQICAVDKANHRDTCQGDSGGPLQLHLPGRRRTRFYVIGITSYGLICGSQQPSVYTRISSYIDWIEQIVWSVENSSY